MLLRLRQSQWKQRARDLTAFTLVELIVYIALLASLLLGLSYYLIATSQFRAKAMAIGEVTDNGRLVLMTLSDYIGRADSVDWSNSQIGNHPGVLKLLIDDVVIEISMDQNGVLLIREANQVISVTSNAVRVTDLVFEKYNDRVIGMNLTLKHWPQSESKNLVFESSWRSAYHLAY